MQQRPSYYCSRRHFVLSGAYGLGATAAAWLLKQDGLLAEPARPELEERHFDLLPKATHHAPRATAMISMFMVGGPSHVDLFDPKPKLAEYDGQPYPGEVKYDNPAQASSKVMAAPWKFERRGECGMELSELLPHLGGIADDISLIRSMRTGVNNHGQSMYALHSGRIVGGNPSLGSWLTFGLGSETQDLPTYMVMTHPDGPPLLAGENWSNGWLPSMYQGTLLRPREPRLLNLEPPVYLRGDAQQRQLAFLADLNDAHRHEHPGESDLEARIASYALAARMQTAAKEALDIRGESQATLAMYGIDQPETRDYGTRCLLARRLVERGVRFVQIYNNGQSWDHHSGILNALPQRCREIDQPSAALVKDLKSRGLLDTTLVHWGGEMGRLPVIQNDFGRDQVGRDHNTYGFSMWLAGGGVRGGYVHGATDDFGYQAVTDVVTQHDYHATVLHLFGLDHTRLTFRRGGQQLSLSGGQPAQVVRNLLA